MPATRITTRQGWIGTRRRAFLEAVQRALVTGLRIPPDDRCIALVEQDADAFLLPEGAGERFSLIEIVLITGRSLKAKRRLYAAMVEELAPFGLGPDEVRVILTESPAENWGLRGRPASEIDLGFAIDV